MGENFTEVKERHLRKGLFKRKILLRSEKGKGQYYLRENIKIMESKGLYWTIFEVRERLRFI